MTNYAERDAFLDALDAKDEGARFIYNSLCDMGDKLDLPNAYMLRVAAKTWVDYKQRKEAQKWVR